jgi:NADH-quinone oxidoreductase subunit J
MGAASLLATTTHYPDWVVFIVAAIAILAGALGVILSRNPVHSALSLVLTLFGVAVEFVNQQADFLAAVQVIVYAGAIVVLFLFVIMLLGVDETEDLRIDPLPVQRPVAVVFGAATLALVILAVREGADAITGEKAAPGASDEPNINQLARALFSNYVFAFEVTSVLLVIAVIATVVLARRPLRRIRDKAADAELEKAGR